MEAPGHFLNTQHSVGRRGTHLGATPASHRTAQRQASCTTQRVSTPGARGSGSPWERGMRVYTHTNIFLGRGTRSYKFLKDLRTPSLPFFAAGTPLYRLENTHLYSQRKHALRPSLSCTHPPHQLLLPAPCKAGLRPPISHTPT